MTIVNLLPGFARHRLVVVIYGPSYIRRCSSAKGERTLSFDFVEDVEFLQVFYTFGRFLVEAKLGVDYEVEIDGD